MKKYKAILVVVIAIVAGGMLLSREKGATQNVEALIENEVVEEVVIDTLDAPTSGDYSLDTERSSLRWTAQRVFSNFHNGTASLRSGSITFDENGPDGGEFVIELTRITESNGNNRFLRQIASDAFFDVDKFPTAIFVMTGAVKTGDTREAIFYDLNGGLTIKDRTIPIVIPAAITYGNGTAHALASFQIDRTLWGLTYDSGSFFEGLGDKAILDNIGFMLDLQFAADE